VLRLFSLLLLAACVTVFAGTARSVAAAEPFSARELYLQALKAMGDLSQPAYVTYRFESTSDGLQADLTTIGGNVWLSIHAGTAPGSWTLRHRTYDYASEIVNAVDGRRYVSHRSFFDPTWYGAFRALRQGMLYSQDPAPPRPTPGDALPTPDPSLKTIGVVSVMGPAVYTIEDRGPATCQGGESGRALHLVSRNRDPQHQLSDVVIDLQSLRFCMMRFGSPAGFGFHGFVEQHYADVGGYWMQTDGLLDGTLRAFGISMHGGVWRYRLRDMQFPSALPLETFL
jgi:hypothetical protein